MLGKLFTIAVSFTAGIVAAVIIFRHDIFQVSDWDGSMPDLEGLINYGCYPEQKSADRGSAEKGR
jgi:hypothetical protein